MRKKILLMFTVIFFVLCALGLTSCKRNYVLNEDGVSYTYNATDVDETDLYVVIPSTYKGLPVTAIGEEAFSGNKTIIGVEISDGVTSIGDSAFASCSSFVSVNR